MCESFRPVSCSASSLIRPLLKVFFLMAFIAEDSIFVLAKGDSSSEVHDMPTSAICRPILSVLDETKVEDFALKISASFKLFSAYCSRVSPALRLYNALR
jgi:hypothetical protein